MNISILQKMGYYSWDMSKANIPTWLKQSIKIDELSLWDENARFPDKYFKKSEKDLIEYFLSDKSAKLKEFAKEVVGDFDLPQLEKIVVFSYKGKNIVLEGNRRIAVYKLLANPLLAKDSETQGYFSGLKAKVKIDDNFRVEIVSTNKKKEGLRYVDRKHIKSNNEVPWGVQERRHHNVRQGTKASTDIFTVELGKIVHDLDLPDEMKEKVLGKGTVTTFYRLMESEPAKRFCFLKKLKKEKLSLRIEKISTAS